MTNAVRPSGVIVKPVISQPRGPTRKRLNSSVAGSAASIWLLPSGAKSPLPSAVGTVIYRSKMHLGLKRNFQVMPGAEWLELLCRHMPDRYEHLVRYVGWYSNRARGASGRRL